MRRATPRRISRSSPRTVSAPRHPAALRRASRGRAHRRRGERCPSLSNYTCPLLAIASHLSFLSAPTYVLPFPFPFLSLSLSSMFFLFLRSPSRLAISSLFASPSVLKCRNVPGPVWRSFVFSPALLGFVIGRPYQFRIMIIAIVHWGLIPGHKNKFAFSLSRSLARSNSFSLSLITFFLVSYADAYLVSISLSYRARFIFIAYYFLLWQVLSRTQ